MNTIIDNDRTAGRQEMLNRRLRGKSVGGGGYLSKHMYGQERMLTF